MKNFQFVFLFFILIVEVKNSSAQTYHPFPDTLAEWSEGTRYCYVSNTRDCSGSGYVYAVVGDTVIDGLQYKLLGYNLAYNWGNSSPEINYPYQFPGQIFGALREDASHKVWFRNFDSLLNWIGCINFYYPFIPFTVDSDMLLYDFGLEVGDTAYWTAYEYNVVRKIDSVQLLDGTWRRAISFDSLLAFYGPDYWIEGIGSHWGLFGPYCKEPFEGECSLNCFKKSDTLVYEGYSFYSLTDCNHIYTNVFSPTVELDNLVSPNPATDFIIFNLHNFATADCEISIYNSTGQTINHFSSRHSTQLKIPVSEIGNCGMYYYMMKVNDETFFEGKFLIQR